VNGRLPSCRRSAESNGGDLDRSKDDIVL